MPRVPITAALLGFLASTAAAQEAPKEDGQWRMPAKDYAVTRFSGLSEITPTNAKWLSAAGTFSTGVLGGHEGQPLVVGSTMYVVTPYPNVVYAFDLTKEGYPLRWKYRPNVRAAAIGMACCDLINRGAFHADGKIVFNQLDGYTMAVDASTGKQVWKTKVAELDVGETLTMAPLVVKNRVIVGNAGGEYGVRGMGKGPRPAERGDRLDRLQRGGTQRCWPGPGRSSHCITPAPSWRGRAGPGTAGCTAAHRSGGGCRTTRRSTWSITARAIPRPTTRNGGWATTGGPRA
jgi:hypothetical protein